MDWAPVMGFGALTLVAAVTAVLKDLLHNGIIDRDLTSSVGDVTVSALPPDRVVTQGQPETSQLNLFLGEWLSHCIACGHELVTVL